MAVVTVQSVARAARLLKVLAARRGDVPLADLAVSAGLPKSTAHGLLQTLVQERLVEHDPTTRRYRLGRGVFVPGWLCERVQSVKDPDDAPHCPLPMAEVTPKMRR